MLRSSITIRTNPVHQMRQRKNCGWEKETISQSLVKWIPMDSMKLKSMVRKNLVQFLSIFLLIAFLWLVFSIHKYPISFDGGLYFQKHMFNKWRLNFEKQTFLGPLPVCVLWTSYHVLDLFINWNFFSIGVRGMIPGIYVEELTDTHTTDVSVLRYFLKRNSTFWIFNIIWKQLSIILKFTELDRVETKFWKKEINQMVC